MKFALLCDSWRSTDGGIQTVNRLLSLALAKANHEVLVVVPHPDEDEIEDARWQDVILDSGADSLLRAPLLIPRFEPDVVCGHGRFTGAAEEIVREAFPSALYVHFIHHDPSETGAFKEHSENRELSREHATNLEITNASAADVIVTIGESLRKVWEPRLHNRAVRHIDVGIEDTPAFTPEKTTRPEILLFGRTDSVGVKGIDLFAPAAGRTVAKLLEDGSSYRPIFVVRGAKGELDALQAKLVDQSREFNPRVKASDIAVREFTNNPHLIEDERRRARLLVMPSRAEGYGLTALEMLSRGVPVIVSSESGVAELIQSTLAEDDSARRWFIWKYGEDPLAIEELSRQMSEIILDQEQWHKQAVRVRDLLRTRASWSAGATQLVNICTEHGVGTRTGTSTRSESMLHSEPVTAIHAGNRAELQRIVREHGGRRGFCLFAGRRDGYLAAYQTLLQNLHKNLDIMGLGLSTFRHDYGHMLAEMAARARVRIALLDPAFPGLRPLPTSVASIREREERQNEGEFRRQVAKYYFDVLEPYLTTAADSAEEPGLEIRLYKVLPAVNIFRVDDAMFFGSYLLEAPPEETPTLLVHRTGEVGGLLFTTMMRHFDEVWKNKDRYRRLQDVVKEELRSWETEETLATEGVHDA